MPRMTLEHGQILHYDDTGRGTAVVLLHSALGDLRQWDPQVPVLAARHRVVRYDERGYGSSANPSGPIDPADDLMRLLDALDIEQAALVGSSMGGTTALHAAVRFPHRVQRVAAIGSGLLGFNPEPEEDARWPDNLESEYTQAVMSGDIDHIIALYAKIWLVGFGGDATSVPEAARTLFLRMNQERLTAHPPEGPEYREDDDHLNLTALHCPVLAIVGEWDTRYCHQVADYIAAHAPDAAIERVARAAHFPNLSQPEVVNRLLLRFLA